MQQRLMENFSIGVLESGGDGGTAAHHATTTTYKGIVRQTKPFTSPIADEWVIGPSRSPV